jgi:putative (di)nucleoside polyphosphate hydrolase
VEQFQDFRHRAGFRAGKRSACVLPSDALMIDEHGFRPNVGIILCNSQGHVFWGRRAGHNGWQFPQGGMKSHESPEQALYRELNEEVGLGPQQVEVLGRTRGWLHYELPQTLRRSRSGPFRGQKQIWFLLHFTGEDQDVQLTLSDRPEFDAWCWIEYWSALEQIIEFKREVYRQAMIELEPLLPVIGAR